jgi:hypothetical protein
MPHLDATLCKKLERHFNAAAAEHEKTHLHSPYKNLFNMIMAANKDAKNAASAELVVPFSYMENNFARVLTEANQIVRDHKGPKA